MKFHWRLKIYLKIILKRLPVSYNFWKKLGLFDHGKMNDAEYAINVFKNHYSLCSPPTGFTFLELGPGDSLSSTLIAKFHNAGKGILIDSGEWANKDINLYTALYQNLNTHKDQNTPFSDVNSLLNYTNSKYLTQGLNDLKIIPSESIDFSFSQAVFEHIRYSELLETIQELYRVHKHNTHSSHVVDLRDHLAESLNNLRFSSKTWESDLYSSSGFYTNRVRFSQFQNMFESIGFKCEVIKKVYWDKLPIKKNKLHKDFKNLNEEDLLIKTFTIVLKK